MLPQCGVKVSVQNYRSALGDLYANIIGLNKSELNLITLPRTTGLQQIKKYVRCKTFEIGSFLCNKRFINNQFRNKYYLFTFRPSYFSKNKTLFGHITWEKYIENEKKLIKWLFQYADRKRININVLGSSKVNLESENHISQICQMILILIL